MYHSGDTAYFEGFAEVGERLKPDVALLPIGAYFQMLTGPGIPVLKRRCRDSSRRARAGPMHYGTFRLGREPMEEPPVRMMAEAERLGIAGKVRVLEEGETMRLPQ